MVDASGHCCWPGQLWKHEACVGTPTRCPAGFEVNADLDICKLAACPDGQARLPDGFHCCWPGMTWSDFSNKCTGSPVCPPNMEATRSGCVATHPPTVEPKSQLGFVAIPPGDFLMGCTPKDDQCYDDEKPPKPDRETVARMRMGQTPVTAAAFNRCIKDDGCTAPNDSDLPNCNLGKHPDHPMNCLNYEQASSFCHWLGGRLPTAVEWEYAARSGEARMYPWGDTPLDGKHANFCDKNCPNALPPEKKKEYLAKGTVDSSQDDGFAATSPVGSYPAGNTKWGLKDMAGNVWEWTTTPLATDRTKIEIRGGSWSQDARTLRTTMHGGFAPDADGADLGFRCVIDGGG